MLSGVGELRLPVWIQILVYGVLIIFLLWLFKNIFMDLLVLLFSKRRQVEATLNSKSELPFVTKRVFVSGARGNVSGGLAEKGMIYRCYFELQDGKYVELDVDKREYDTLVERESGILDYRGKRFYSFSGRKEGTYMEAENNTYEFISVDKTM